MILVKLSFFAIASLAFIFWSGGQVNGACPETWSCDNVLMASGFTSIYNDDATLCCSESTWVRQVCTIEPASCSDASLCCWCDGGTQYKCAPKYYKNEPTGTVCGTAYDCSNRYCSTQTFWDGSCPPVCKSTGTGCSDGSECCTGYCNSGFCGFCIPSCPDSSTYCPAGPVPFDGCGNYCSACPCIPSCPDPGTYCPAGPVPYDGCGNYCPACPPSMPPAIGYVKIKHPFLGILRLRLISFANAKIALKGIVKVARFNGDINTAADLVETNDPNASPVRIKTPYGIKAWRMQR